MTPDAATLRQIIVYCTHKWIEAEHDDVPGFNTPDGRAARQMAYNDVLHHARSLLGEGA